MLTVLESINLSTEYLSKKGIESARLNAELLLADILNCKRFDLYLKFDRPLSIEEKDKYRDYLKRRGDFEPLQYITGWVEFYGMKIKTSPAALIPRQETEILIEETIKNSGATGKIKILDIGTGTGNIAIALAKNISDSEIHSIDVSEAAIKLARENSKINRVENSIKFILDDILTENFVEKISTPFDIIVSNPPYVSEEEFNTLQKEIVLFEPKNSVSDYADGYTFYKRIGVISKKILKSGGKIFLELGKGQAEIVKNILEENNFTNINIVKDYSGIERVIRGEMK